MLLKVSFNHFQKNRIKVMVPIKRPMSRRYTSPVTKNLSCLHGTACDEPAAFVLHLWFRCFYECRSHCFAPGTHQDQDQQNVAVCSPWHIIMPQKTFSTIPCPSGLSVSRTVAHKVQPIMAQGIGKTVSHAIFITAL